MGIPKLVGIEIFQLSVQIPVFYIVFDKHAVTFEIYAGGLILHTTMYQSFNWFDNGLMVTESQVCHSNADFQN